MKLLVQRLPVQLLLLLLLPLLPLPRLLLLACASLLASLPGFSLAVAPCLPLCERDAP